MKYKQKISEIVNQPADMIVPPKDPAMGDYALPCFKLAAEFKKPPQIIADEFAAKINADLPDFLESVTAVAGYLNFKLNKTQFAKDVIEKVLAAGENYGSSEVGAGKTVCIDYSSINIAKPFHIGHLLATTLGAALYRIYGKLGYKTVGINHLGDWGTQFGKLIVAYKKWGDKKDVEARGVRSFLDIYVKFHDEAERDEALNDEARLWFKKIEDGDAEALELFNFFKEVTLKEVGKIYDRLHVKFDSYAGESFYNDKMQPVIDELAAKNLLTESEGAAVVKFPNDEMPPCLILRSDGASLYATRDLAAMFYRKKTYNFDKCLYVVAYQQNLHFKQVFKVVEMMGRPWAKDLAHVAFGMVSLEGEAMSTRKGKIAFLDDVLNQAHEKALKIMHEKRPPAASGTPPYSMGELDARVAEQIGIGAVIFGVLHGSRIKDIDFRFDQILNFDGETAPYIQYTVARAGSVLEKGNISPATGVALPLSLRGNFSSLDNPEAAEVLRCLNKYPEIIEAAAEKFEPGIVARFAVDLASAYNKFYFEHKIAGDPARLALTLCTKTVLTNAMGLLGVECPDRM